MRSWLRRGGLLSCALGALSCSTGNASKATLAANGEAPQTAVPAPVTPAVNSSASSGDAAGRPTSGSKAASNPSPTPDSAAPLAPAPTPSAAPAPAVSTAPAAGAGTSAQPVDSGPPVATDAASRIVGILYSVWADHFATSRDASGQAYVMSNGAPYGPFPTYNWWGIPAYGIDNYHFMFGNDPNQPNDALIDYHADLLHAAGVDFIAIDLTNGQQDLIVKGAQAVARRYAQRDPARTPRIVLFVQNTDSVAALAPIFFAGAYPNGIWFYYGGKPLMLIGQADSPSPSGGALDQFTTRHTWGLQGSSDKWSFKLNTGPGNPGTAYYLGGWPEEMSVAAACQGTYMTAPANRRGRNNGAYFAEQWSYVFAVKPKFVFVTAWNEWGAQNIGDPYNPVFTDAFGEEYSADVEPMQGGHGAHYYDLLKTNIAVFKAL